MDEETLADVESRLEWVTLQSGERLIERGAPSDAMYLLLCGRLSVTIPGQGGASRRLTEVKPSPRIPSPMPSHPPCRVSQDS